VGARFERFVLDLLPAIGLIPKATRFKVYREGVEVGEVDIVAVDEKGETYAIEVKAGRVDISGIRQAYTNAKILGARPMVIARGYADEGARQLARELGVEVILLPDYFFLSIDDLYVAFTNALARFVTAVVSVYTNLSENEIEAIRECKDMQCICQKINCEALFERLPKEAKNLEIILLAIQLRNLLPLLCAKATNI